MNMGKDNRLNMNEDAKSLSRLVISDLMEEYRRALPEPREPSESIQRENIWYWAGEEYARVVEALKMPGLDQDAYSDGTLPPQPGNIWYWAKEVQSRNYLQWIRKRFGLLE